VLFCSNHSRNKDHAHDLALICSRKKGAIMPEQTPEIESPLNQLDDSIVAQLIEVGLLARYRNDIEGSTEARRRIRAELLSRGWVLPPYTYEGDV